MAEEPLDGGNLGGAVRVGDTVRRVAGPWTSAVHSLLDHLEHAGFSGAPRARGVDDQGREILTFLPGETVGSQKPWPGWVRADTTLDATATWMRRYHDAVANFAPSADAIWRSGGTWEPGLIIGHNDAAPYNAAWDRGSLTGFFDWDFAGPVTQDWDLAYAAFSWVPLHARAVVTEEGFTDFSARPQRLRRFLEIYGWTGDVHAFVDVIRNRVQSHIDDLHALAAGGDPDFRKLLELGTADRLCDALREMESIQF